jgi:hypothetical protein
MSNEILNIAPPPYHTDDPKAWKEWARTIYPRLQPGPFTIPGYVVVDVPDATKWGDGTNFTSIIMVSDETGGLTLAYSDGTNWLRTSDRTAIS